MSTSHSDGSSIGTSARQRQHHWMTLMQSAPRYTTGHSFRDLWKLDHPLEQREKLLRRRQSFRHGDDSVDAPQDDSDPLNDPRYAGRERDGPFGWRGFSMRA